MASPFGVVMAGRETAQQQPALNGSEVKLAYGMGEWTAQIARMLHDAELDQEVPGSTDEPTSQQHEEAPVPKYHEPASH